MTYGARDVGTWSARLVLSSVACLSVLTRVTSRPATLPCSLGLLGRVSLALGGVFRGLVGRGRGQGRPTSSSGRVEPDGGLASGELAPGSDALAREVGGGTDEPAQRGHRVRHSTPSAVGTALTRRSRRSIPHDSHRCRSGHPLVSFA